MSMIFPLSFDQTHVHQGFFNESPDFHLLKRHIKVDSLIPSFLADPRI